MAFVGPLDSFNSNPIQTKVGTSQTNIFTATSTKVVKDSNGKVIGGKTTLYYSPNAGEYIPAATTTDGGKTWSYLKDSNGKEILGADAKTSLEKGLLKNNTQQQIVSATTRPIGGISKEDQKMLASSTKNNATTSTSADSNAAKVDPKQEAAIQKEAGTFLSGTKEKYSDAKYPLDLKAEKQDCIKFTIIKYKPSGLSTAQKPSARVVTVENSRPVIGKEFLGTITLPIPGGISDQNLATWSPDSIDTLMKGAADVVSKFIGGGADAAGGAAKSDLGGITGGGTGSLESYVTAKATEGALGGSANVLGRQFGAVVNPNMELLFSGPELRQFRFTFKMSPREEKEAKEVRKIIRYFKQAMSVKRSQSTLLLKSPFTFAISYISGNKQHPYLNKFKECALTDCSVNYTPYGTYMTYAGEPSMVAYELSLSFQELEPLFDDEYGDEANITNIGF